MNIKVILVDDDKMITYALKTILENEKDIEIVGIGNNYEDAVRLFEEYQPDIALLDIQMGEKSGIDVLQTIIAKNPEAKVLFLTTFADEEYIRSAIQGGAKGYLLKSDFENIVISLRAVFAGQNVYGTEIIQKIPLGNQTSHKKSRPEFLTDRECDIIELLAAGMSNKEIAAKLFLSEGTVRNHISIVLDKLELRDRTQLAIYWLKNEN